MVAVVVLAGAFNLVKIIQTTVTITAANLITSSNNNTLESQVTQSLLQNGKSYQDIYF